MTTLTLWATVRCCKPRWIRNAVRKWDNDKQNVGVVGQVNNQAPALGPHMNRNVIAQYLKERLLEMKQTPIRVGDMLKKPAIGDKTKPLGF